MASVVCTSFFTPTLSASNVSIEVLKLQKANVVRILSRRMPKTGSSSHKTIIGFWIGPDIDDGWGFVEASVNQFWSEEAICEDQCSIGNVPKDMLLFHGASLARAEWLDCTWTAHDLSSKTNAGDVADWNN